MKSIVRSMEINTQKLGTASRISWCEQIENGQQVWWIRSPTQNIGNKHHTSNRSPFCKGVKMQKGASVLIRWQIMHVCPTQTTQSISNKSPLQAFHSVNTNIIERVPHATSSFGRHRWIEVRQKVGYPTRVVMLLILVYLTFKTKNINTEICTVKQCNFDWHLLNFVWVQCLLNELQWKNIYCVASIDLLNILRIILLLFS
jgi:hypothetical protein